MLTLTLQCCGVSMEYGKAMGLNKAVTPIFPKLGLLVCLSYHLCNFRVTGSSSTGVAGSTVVLDALVQRAEKGGSYAIDVSHLPPPNQRPD